MEIRVERASLKRRPLGQSDGQRRQKRLEIFGGHVLGGELDVEGGCVAGVFIGAVEMGRGAADLEQGRMQDSGKFTKIVRGVKVDSYRDSCRRSARDEQGFGEFCRTLGFGFTVLRGKRAVEIQDAPKSQRGIEDTGGGET